MPITYRTSITYRISRAGRPKRCPGRLERYPGRPKRYWGGAASAWLIVVAALFLASAAWAGPASGAKTFAPGADAIVGTWLTQKGDARVMIYKKGGEFLGKLVWLRQPNGDNGLPAIDDKNPDPRLRGGPILGLVIIHARYNGPNSWKGRVYDPDSGDTYSCSLSLASPSALKLRGYLVIPLLGRTETWKRVF
ncbi:MAG: DUF2147 domain-containing protein [Nitrospiraceae bacterium]|nr:DUF2147 domain-containing protein [Nitrospiraceae bacterium]